MHLKTSETHLSTEATADHEEWKQSAYRSAIMPNELPAEFQAREGLLPSATSERVQVSRTTRLGLGALLIALLSGITGDWLLRQSPWGINLLLWTIIVTTAVTILVRREHPGLVGNGKWLMVPLLLFAAGFAWRDSVTLKALDLLGMFVTLSLLALRSRTGKLAVASLTDYFGALLGTSLFTSIGLLQLVFSDIGWATLPRDGWAKQAIAVARGVLFAVPLLLLFGGLFVAADAVFENLVARTFNLGSENLFPHLLIFGLIATPTAGFLRLLLLDGLPLTSPGENKTQVSLSIVEIGIVLGLLNVLFLSFVIVQFSYLFGGMTNLRPGAGYQYAIYARRGFFELVWVAGLVLPLLSGSHWLLRKDEPKHELIFRGLAGGLVAMLFVIMASAMQRMRLYQYDWGMTELRFYTVVFMIWLALVFIWFALTVLRGQRARFVFGATLSGFAMIVVLHVINPDYQIARVNMVRAREGRNADEGFRYTTSLSTDALPAIADALQTLNSDDQLTIGKRLYQRLEQGWLPVEVHDWRSWNWSRHQGRPIVWGILFTDVTH